MWYIKIHTGSTHPIKMNKSVLKMKDRIVGVIEAVNKTEVTMPVHCALKIHFRL